MRDKIATAKASKKDEDVDSDGADGADDGDALMDMDSDGE